MLLVRIDLRASQVVEEALYGATRHFLVALGSHKDAVGFYCFRLFTRQTLETYAHINKKSNNKNLVHIATDPCHPTLAPPHIPKFIIELKMLCTIYIIRHKPKVERKKKLAKKK